MKKLIVIGVAILALSACVISKSYNKDSNGMFMPSNAYFDRNHTEEGTPESE